MSATPLSSSAPAGETSNGPLRLITPNRSLPNRRAVVGGILIAVSLIGTYFAATGAGGDARRPVVVAARDLAPGSTIASTDLRVVRMQLSPEAAARASETPSKFVGSTLLGPVTAGEIVQSGLVAAKTAVPDAFEISFALPAARALDGRLKAGETVDVLATDKGATTTAARAAVTNATIVSVASVSSNGGIGRTGDITVTLALTARADASAVAAAIDQGLVTLVRTTGSIDVAAALPATTPEPAI